MRNSWAMPIFPAVQDLAYLAEPLTRFISDILNLHNLRCKKGIWTNSCFAQLTRLPYELNLLSSLPRIASLWFKLCAKRMLVFEACPIEIKHRKLRYTLDTIKELSEQYPSYDLFVIVGADQFNQLSKWKGIEELIRLVHFLVFARGSKQVPEPPLSKVRMTYMENPLIDLSSTTIRNTLRSGTLPLDKLPPAVCSYLTEHNLFPLPNNYS